jgi:cleavage stimulation factor subunit 2
LNGADCGGRPLRIDLADSDPFLEGKTTVRGEIVDAGDHHQRPTWGPARSKPDAMHAFMAGLPTGTPLPPGMGVADAISRTLATMDPQQLIEVLAQMKVTAFCQASYSTLITCRRPLSSLILIKRGFSCRHIRSYLMLCLMHCSSITSWIQV